MLQLKSEGCKAMRTAPRLLIRESGCPFSQIFPDLLEAVKQSSDDRVRMGDGAPEPRFHTITDSMRRFAVTCLFLTLTLAAQTSVKPIPPPGVTVPETDAAQLRQGLAKIAGNSNPDIAVFEKAVKWALDDNEFFKPEDIAHAKEILSRAQSQPKTGLIVHAYRSKIDGSLQPYGLVVPENYSPSQKWRLDTWFHGRNENLSEVNFIYDRLTKPGEFTPKDTIVLHLYGRYCNASKFAGEVDLFEALDDVRKRYAIDNDRIIIRGFSMGGASAWQTGAHYAGLWAAVAPGAGFAETPEFLKMRAEEVIALPDWQRKLWHLYNATDYALNFFNVPVIAYSGEIDGQKQAADIMAKYLKREGIDLPHIIGPQTGHKYHPESKIDLDKRLAAIAERGRDPLPKSIRFVTYTLRYNQMEWVTIDAMSKHWEPARIDGELRDGSLALTTENVDALTLDLRVLRNTVIDGQSLRPAPSYHRRGSKWVAGKKLNGKRHGVQGPIDDAFMDSFIIVKPSGKPSEWVESEMNRAIREWRRQFRGEPRVKLDSEITPEDIKSANLALWGDPQSNSVYKRVAGKLPLAWPKEQNRSLILIAPNPENPNRYVVLNSGFTFREFDYLNNARQVPKLPDWAIIDTTVPPDAKAPGKIVEAGFFDENWKHTR